VARKLLMVICLVVAACSGTATPTPTRTPTQAGSCWDPSEMGELVAIPVSSELAVGSNRFLLNLVDRDNEPLASPDRQVEMRFFAPGACDAPAVTAAAAYLPTIASLPGLYRAVVDFDAAGDWGLEVNTTEPDGSNRIGRMTFSVREEFSTPEIGEQAPASETPTADSPDEIATLSTDDDPNPAFYTTSVADALEAGEPFLLVFSTPAFCRTATCGPALDIVKGVAPEFEDEVTFIHVEPYELEQTDGGLQPVLNNGQLVPVPSVVEWGLLTEPYIFVVDGAGKVSAKLEGVASEEEIRAALEEVTQ
jgi:hypothetical protein